MESERTTLTARNKSLDGPGGPAGSDREEVEALAEHSTAGKGRSACGTAQEAETPWRLRLRSRSWWMTVPDSGPESNLSAKDFRGSEKLIRWEWPG